MEIVVENLEEVMGILGRELWEFEVLSGEDAYCADKEILMEFSNGKEIRIYVDKEGNLCVYSD